MFVELPVSFIVNDEEEVALQSLDIDEIGSFSQEGKNTAIRLIGRDDSFIIAMGYDEFKEKFESIHGKIVSFINVDSLI